MKDIHERPTNFKVAVAYMRTATADRQGIRIGLAVQYQACQEYADAVGLHVSAIYCDLGVSGLAEYRPALDQLMYDLSEGRVRHVVVANADRLARNGQLEKRLRQRIRGHGADVSSPSDSRQPLTEGGIDDATRD